MASQNTSKAERKLSEEQQRVAETKKFNRNVIIVVAVFLVALVVVLLFNSNLFYTKTGAVTINGTKYSAVDFNFFYVNEYNTIYQTVADTYGDDVASSYMPSSSTSLGDQIYDSTTGQTWKDFLTERTMQRLTRVTALCDAANEAGYELSEDQLSDVYTNYYYLAYYATVYYGMDTDSYLVYMYGDRMTQDIYIENATRLALAGAYASVIEESFDYTVDELTAEYAANADDYDYVSFQAMLVYADTDNHDTLDEAMESASAQAESIASQITDSDSFTSQEMSYVVANADVVYGNDSDYVVGLTYTNQGSDIPDLFKDWLLDSSRQYGDVATFAYGGEEDSTVNGYYIVMYTSRDNNDYNSVNGYYLLVSPESLSSDDYETTDEYNEAVAEASQAALDEANVIYADWTSGDYESVDDLVTDYSNELSDYAEIAQAGVNDISTTLSSWYFDSSRKDGDSEVIEGSDGYYIAIYYGQDDTVANLFASESLRDADYSAWEADLTADYSYKTSWTMRFTRGITSLGG